ncbi:hypothetical protein BGS_0781 [Beggiatoa sp. SS]|nr:hypothetical protein BGS_0781 [Beggiatoa sp. SS]
MVEKLRPLSPAIALGGVWKRAWVTNSFRFWSKGYFLRSGRKDMAFFSIPKNSCLFLGGMTKIQKAPLGGNFPKKGHFKNKFCLQSNAK